MTDFWSEAIPSDAPADDSCDDRQSGGDREHGLRPRVVARTLKQLATATFPPRRALLVREQMPVVRAGDIGEIYAPRGLGKTWMSMTLGLIAATGAEALGFSAGDPTCRVLLVDGEMAITELQERFAHLQQVLGIHCPDDDRLLLVSTDDPDGDPLPRLDTPEGQRAIEPFVNRADLIFLDNRSCLLDPNGEKDPSAWQPTQDWLLSLRRRSKAVILNHHANRQGTARGHSKPEDAMNVLISLAQPENYSQAEGARFVATFEKSRGVYGVAVAPFEAHLTTGGWIWHRVDAPDPHRRVADKLIEVIRQSSADGTPVRSANQAIKAAKVNRGVGLEVWAELAKTGRIHKHDDGDFSA